MLPREELLAPIAGSSPGGTELRYDPIYGKIKEARREDIDAPQGEWQRERKTADWPLVVKLAQDAIKTKSKDLQLAAWLTEAQLRRDGFSGLRAGLDLLIGLLEQHWDHLYPAVEDGDAEMRAAPLEWVGSKLDVAVRLAPVDKDGHEFSRYAESRTVPTEEEAGQDYGKRDARKAALDEHKLSPEEFERSFAATPKTWYKALVADIDGTLAAIAQLDTLSRQKFGDVAPSYNTLRAAAEQVQRVAKQLLQRKLELEPDPVEVVVETLALEGGDVAGGGGTAAEARSLAPASRDAAASQIAAAAKYLRQTEPFSPAPYLVLRGFRWGELRAGGQNIDPRLLDAPPTAVRTQIKRLLLDAKWLELLEHGETVMASPSGRGWLDLQRYVVSACDELGSEYETVGRAIRGEVRSLLADFPHLVDATLMDDTPTANAETRVWLQSNGLLGDGKPRTARDNGQADDDEASGGNGSSGNGSDTEMRVRDPRSAAAAEARAGRPERAVAILLRESAREKTRRGKFLCQAQLASIMVDSGHETVAMPILEELITAVEEHKLEDWEAGDLVAQPLALLYRVLEKTSGDPDRRQSLYLRICRLDPIQAMSFPQA